MTTLIKRFDSKLDTEDWIFVPSDPAIIGVWYPPHKSSGRVDKITSSFYHQANDPLKSLGGSLRTSCKIGTPSTPNSYWSLLKTWESLGIPASSVINSIQVSYKYRWQISTTGYYAKDPGFVGTDVGVGPLSIYDNVGTFEIELSPEVFCIDRTTGINDWKHYPNGSTVNSPIAQSGWNDNIGAIEIIPAPVNPSATQVEFRILVRVPKLNDGGLRTKIDTMVLTIDYTSGGGSFNRGNNFLIFT